MTAIISTAYSRDLGDELRRLRETCTRLGGRAMAAQLGWDPSKVSNIENGKARASEIDLAQYLATCGKDLDYLQEFSSRYRHAFEPYIVLVNDNLRTITMAESTATKITSYDVLTVHGLVQTRSYTRALFREAGRVSEDDIDEYVELRMGRQTIWRRVHRPQCTFYLHELALRVHPGDDVVMWEQCRRLLHRSHVLRIVPADANGVAMRSKCTLFEFDKAAPVAYCESDLAKVFAQDSAAIADSRKQFERLDAVALDEERSRSMLMGYVSRLRGDQDESHVAQEQL
ncbi:Helix-turn-helix domain-containing protein [Lentzea fradiae]|uniref:Helix-turn-helix domain-containing protein n=1 Tax=Lentzea fradiae TaxID=200378 RepID=A0A1G7RHW9_9PSEU|nr:helix-turn-helix transcriptional regulator [Lentzea fradiae]SDG10358.1 Helix-turn-helix domain-containing protein [Lentzea fradiae]